jgi:copper chaperone
METLKFKTNIKCGGCVAKVTPFLNETPGIAAWEVDTGNADKILSVRTDKADAEQVKRQVEKAGFRAEKIG